MDRSEWVRAGVVALIAFVGTYAAPANESKTETVVKDEFHV